MKNTELGIKLTKEILFQAFRVRRQIRILADEGMCMKTCTKRMLGRNEYPSNFRDSNWR